MGTIRFLSLTDQLHRIYGQKAASDGPYELSFFSFPFSMLLNTSSNVGTTGSMTEYAQREQGK